MKHMSRIAIIAALPLLSMTMAHAQEFVVNNLVTNNQAANHAQFQDPLLVNAWGVSRSGTSPFWVSNNGTGTSTLYSVDPTTDHVSTIVVPGKLPAIIPGNGTVTGQAFNSGAGSGAFNGDAFLFVSLDGTVSGWRFANGAHAETLQPASNGNVYTGSAFATISGHSYLYAANFATGHIDVLKGDAAAPNLTGSFSDPNLPAGYSPFNIQNLNGKLYVAYAPLSGVGTGFVDVYDLNGNNPVRVGSQGTLNSPWGLAIAPSSFGKFAGDLLVGNFGNGTINAFNLGSNSFVGQLDGTDGKPLAIDGLWSLIPGNDGGAGSSQRIYFSAGPQGGSNGLFGDLRAVPEPGVNAMLAAGLLSTGLLAIRRTRKRA